MSWRVKSIQVAKNLVGKAPILTYGKQKRRLMIQCDTSERAFGAALLQDRQPISIRTRALTPTEVCYAQIEKNMLAVVLSLNTFYQYTFGRQSTVITDPKLQ